jgi:Uncharacterised protein family (UPF0014)
VAHESHGGRYGPSRGKVAIVTGGASGIHAVVERLRRRLEPVGCRDAARGAAATHQPLRLAAGKILGGVPPAEAVKYQILVMFLIAGGTGLGAVTAVLGGVYRLTDGRHCLRHGCFPQVRSRRPGRGLNR